MSTRGPQAQGIDETPRRLAGTVPPPSILPVPAMLLRCWSAVVPTVLALLALPALAQTGTLEGRVVDAVTQEPLPGANVVVVGSDQTDDALLGAATDLDGRFAITGVPAGPVTLEARFVGYRPLVKPDVVVQPSRPTFVLLELRPTTLTGTEAVVTADAFTVEPDAPTSVQTLEAEAVRRTPGGQNDISRTLLSLPGVVGGTDTRNDILVRGGGPSENAYFLDGIRIPQINHFATQGATGGALGLVNVDFVREVTFVTGAFPARYGDALSSVLLIDNRPGSSDGLSGDVTLGAAEAGLTLDGPLGSKATGLVSVRRSYLQFLFEALGLPIRPNYWDFQTRVQFDPNAQNRFTLVGLGALDEFDIVAPDDADDVESQDIFDRVLDNDQRSYTVGATWRRLIADGFFTVAASRSVTDFTFADVDKTGTEVLRNESVEAENRIRVDAERRLRPGLTLGAGAGLTRASIGTAFFQAATPATPFDEALRFENDLGFWKSFGYAQLTARLFGERLTATGGLRVDGNSFLDTPAYVGPRLSLAVQLAPRWTLSAATGVLYQTPPLIGLAVQDDAGAYVNRGLPLLRADHYVAGLAWQPRPAWRLSVEGFFKDYRDYPVSASDPRISLANLGGDYGFVGAEPLLGAGEGRSYGVEAFAQRQLVERFYLLGAYTLAWSEFTGQDGVYKPSAWDVRHTVSLTAGLRLGRAWELGAKWRYNSGQAFTPFDLELSAEEYARTGRAVLDFDRLGEARLPAYHRLDLRVDRRFAFRGWNAVVYLDVQNVYARTNVAGFAYTTDPAEPDNLRTLDNVGLLPNFGFSVEF